MSEKYCNTCKSDVLDELTHELEASLLTRKLFQDVQTPLDEYATTIVRSITGAIRHRLQFRCSGCWLRRIDAAQGDGKNG